MIIAMKIGADKKQIKAVESEIKENNLKSQKITGEERVVLAVKGALDADKSRLKDHFEAMAGVESVKPISKPYRLASKEFAAGEKVLIRSKTIGDAMEIKFNGKEVIMMAGPCSVESRSQMDETASFLSGLGVKVLRGGAYKPRTAPGGFEGLKEEGLKIMAEMRDKYNMMLITEMLDVDTANLVAEYIDIIQIGTRNMQHVALLRKAGSFNKPVFLKRGMSATIEELLCAAEYIMQEQDIPQVILCERGIRTFEPSTRNTFDINAIPNLADKTWLPVVADPSHGTGYSNLVSPVAWAAIAAGANGLMIEVHPNPEKAMTDGKQSLNFEQFTELYKKGQEFAQIKGKTLI